MLASTTYMSLMMRAAASYDSPDYPHKHRKIFELERTGKPIGGNVNKKNPVRKANKKRKKKRGW